MEQRALGIAITLLALAGGACDFAPRCPANTQYDGTIRRCTVLDAGGPVDAFVPEVDAGTQEDAGADEDGGDEGDADIVDGGDDDGGTDDGGADGGDDTDGGPTGDAG